MGPGGAPQNEFVAEAREHLATVCDTLLTLERSTAEEAAERFDRLLRAIHSIKGGAGFLGHRTIQRVAHATESLLEAARDGHPPLNAQLIDTLLASSDLLAALLDDLDHSNDWDVSDLVDRLESAGKHPNVASVVEVTDVPDAEPTPSNAGSAPPFDLTHTEATSASFAPAPAAARPSARTDLASPQVAVHAPADDERSTAALELLLDLHQSCANLSTDVTGLITQVSELGRCESHRVEVPDIAITALSPATPITLRCRLATTCQPDAFEQLCSQIGLAVVSCTATTTHVASAPVATQPSTPNLTVASDASVEPSPSHVADAPIASPTAVTANPSAAPSAAMPLAGDRSGTLRIPIHLVDRLMNLAGELVLARNQTRRFTEQNLPLPASVVQRLNAVTAEFQEVILQTRMQPVGQLFGKFPRLVRDLARQLGKQIELRMEGTEVELDKTILDAMSDPLTHLVRNSCDHGIESPEKREQAGKPAWGTITLRARHLGDQISIEIADDGGGINRERVKQQALRQGLRTAEQLARLDDRELLGLILLPGFSTAASVTDVSGRGVGMDVVKTSVEQQSGHLEIHSTPGYGTTFTLRLPLTLAIIPCLMVKAGGQRFALPQKDIEELVCTHAKQDRVRIERTADQEYARLRGRLLPLVRLGQVLNHSAALSSAERRQMLQDHHVDPDETLLFAVVRAGEHRFGLAIDQVESSEEIVVKPMHGSLRHLRIFAGATILGDGTVSLILNCEGIARHAEVRFGDDAQAAQLAAAAEEQATTPVLLCRNSSPEPLAVPLDTIRRIVMVRQEQIEWLGGQRYVTIDQVPTRLWKLEELNGIGSTADAPLLFALLPRRSTTPMALAVEQIVDTTAIGEERSSPATATIGVSSLAIVNDQTTLVLDLLRLASAASPRGAMASVATPASPARILLVEDTQFFRELVRGYLTGAGYNVTIAENGREGVERFDQGEFDLIVSDLEMPHLDGWGFAREIRQHARGRQIPLIALTTLSGDAPRQRAFDAGFDDFLVKVDRRELLDAIQHRLGTAATNSHFAPATEAAHG